MSAARPEPAVLALGGNLGDSVATLRAAVGFIADTPELMVRGVSGLWQTAAVGGPPQPDYLNAVLLVSTIGSPRELLVTAHCAEQAAGRERRERWGPRTLDVDILAFDSLNSDDPELTLPHPRAHLRAFVLAPWSELTPEWPLTAAGRTQTVAQWLAEVRDQEVAPAEPAGRWWQ
ncbi:MAG: 2-amino-4-hydroxy-6-hydroxymethyldihydropteridine diphosphokinase [Candidatus Nanopelagicales bacterium]